MWHSSILQIYKNDASIQELSESRNICFKTVIIYYGNSVYLFFGKKNKKGKCRLLKKVVDENYGNGCKRRQTEILLNLSNDYITFLSWG